MLNFKTESDLKAIILTASKILKADNLDILSELLKQAIPTIQRTGYDNWNNGVDLYTLYLTVSVDTFIKVKSDLKTYETTILETVGQICIYGDDEFISTAKILPSVVDESDEYTGFSNILSEPTFWKPGHFKLFISHLATFKVTASALKESLEKYGISGFVAHEDIEPTKEWQDEIEQGLFTMEALCAILIQGFSESNWTDQEIGVAIGRRILVIPIRKGLNPYGFIGKYQGFQAEGRTVGQVALGIFQILSSNPRTSNNLILKLSELFLLSNTTAEAIDRIKALRLITSVPLERVEAIKLRVTDNVTLKSGRVLKEINEFFKSYGLTEVKVTDFDKAVAGEDDDLPF
ncbi:toll/interleukin-1 receptor domain-containing protein [Pedobacter sp.]|uniref:toll/interleukin-1 receptor domain-containing protein n=1 Tax=Pedobacter sp. TaxID=1411316 RepID=UPI0031E3585E